MFSREPGEDSRSVLIVDASQDSRDVLRTVLERPGTVVLEAGAAREGLQLAARHRPRVIVLDLEAERADEVAVQETFDAYRTVHPGALVVLGKARRYTDGRAETCMLSKPYHYRELVRTIEQFLAEREALEAADDPAH